MDAENHGQKIVLIVDDDASVRTALGELVTQEGWRAVTADNGEDALKRLSENKPDLILLDTRMHIMDGWEFKEQMDEDPRYRDIPVFFLSGMGSYHPEKIKAEGFILKPFDIDELLARKKPYLEN